MKELNFTDAEYTIINEFVDKFGIKKFISLLNYWKGNAESTEDLVYTLTEYLMTD